MKANNQTSILIPLIGIIIFILMGLSSCTSSRYTTVERAASGRVHCGQSLR